MASLYLYTDHSMSCLFSETVAGVKKNFCGRLIGHLLQTRLFGLTVEQRHTTSYRAETRFYCTMASTIRPERNSSVDCTCTRVSFAEI